MSLFLVLQLIIQSKIEKVTTNGKHHRGGVPENAIDNDIQSFWETGKKNSEDFKNDFTVEFKELVEISKMTYKIRTSKTGFANKYEIYGSKTSDGDDFELIAKGSGDTTLDTMEINFEEAQVKRIKIVFVEAERDWASIADLGFYREDKVSAEVDSVFEDKLYTTLSPNYNTISKITELEEKIKNHPFEEDLRVVTNLAKSILSGEEVNKSEVIKLSQRGDENAEKLRTKQRYAGSNFDLTGYYAMPGESIEVYVDANKDDILPQIVFSQVGDVDILKPESNAKPNFRMDLKPGRNVIEVPSPELATKPFAIYFSNRAFPNEQEYAPKVRIAGDALEKYPIYIHGKTDVNEYIEQVKNHTGHNMTDVMGDRFLISTQNTEAKIAYLENNKTPLDLVKEMESMISIYDNISGLDKNDENPLHRPSTGLYHMKLTNGGGSFACNEYVHFSSKGGRNFLKGEIYSWGYLHEFAHQIESNRMRLNEITNNIYSLTTSLIKGVPLDAYVDAQIGMVDKFLIDEEGGFEGGFTYGAKLLAVYQILNYFGVDTYTEASRVLREDPDRYANLDNITSFILIMSEVTGYDLSPHFEFYNFPVTNETKAFTSKFKTLDKKIKYTLPNANQMISDNVEKFNDETKAVIEDIKTESDGYTLTIGTNDDNKGTVAYEIYRDGKLVGISRGKTYKDIVDPTKLYDYEVVAYDYRVNESIKSEPLNSAIGFKPLFEIEENVQVEMNKEFNPKDYVKALTYDGKDISDKMTITSNVDISKIGIYTVNCSVEDNGTIVESKFDVEVVSSIDYASDLDWESATSGWSNPVEDKAVGSKNKIKLNIDGKVKEFDKGLSAAANSEIVYDIEGKKYDHFIAYAGTDKNYNKSQTSLKFKILADDKEVYSSELMKHNSDAEFIKIPLQGVKELKLIADDNGDGISGDFASWGDARFTSRDTAPTFKIEEDVQVEMNKEFNPKDYVKALTYDGKDISDKITITSNVDISKRGIYTVNCSVKDNGNTVESKFDVEVVSSIDYASDLDWESATSGWSKPVEDKAVGSNNKIKLNIDGKVKEFDKGLSAAANSEIVYDIEGKKYDHFIAYAGTDKNYNKSQTSLKFKILADDKEVYSSELMKHNSNAEFIKIPLQGVKELKLIADDNGDGISGDFASWGDARFISRDTAPTLEIDNSISTKVGEPIEDIIGSIKATDKEDGDLTSKVKVDAPENIKFNKPGEYKITYTVTDSDNNTITKERTIAIVDMNDEKYLTDYDWKSAVQSHSVTKKDISASDRKLRLTGQDGEEVVYERGIGSHSKAEIVYDLSDKNYEYFTSFVGVDRQQYNTGASVTFEVYVDGEKRFDSGLMTAKTAQKFIEVDINGAKELKLVVTDGGNGIGHDHATFGDAKLHFVNTERVDLSKLESAIEKANSIEKANYTEETVSKLEQAVNKANEVLELDIITQEQCDKALANIEEAINGLVSIDKEIKIKDEYLEKEIKKELGVTGRALTIRDMYKLTSLTCESYYVRSLEGLEYAKNLETLNIDYNEIADISPISKLEKLKNFSGKENYRDKSDEIKFENGKYIIEENVVDVNGERLQPKEVILSKNTNPVKLNLEEVLVDNKVVIDASLVGDKNSVDIVYESKTHDYQLYVFSFLDNNSDTYDNTKVYNAGDIVIYKGEIYIAKWWVQGEYPDKSEAWEKEKEQNEDGITLWTEGMVCNEGDIVVYNGKKYQAKWWTTSTPGSDDSWKLIL